MGKKTSGKPTGTRRSTAILAPVSTQIVQSIEKPYPSSKAVCPPVSILMAFAEVAEGGG